MTTADRAENERWQRSHCDTQGRRTPRYYCQEDEDTEEMRQ